MAAVARRNFVRAVCPRGTRRALYGLPGALGALGEPRCPHMERLCRRAAARRTRCQRARLWSTCTRCQRAHVANVHTLPTCTPGQRACLVNVSARLANVP
eukprot:359471-Chlamydomonas_euryale.AAC.1